LPILQKGRTSEHGDVIETKNKLCNLFLAISHRRGPQIAKTTTACMVSKSLDF